MKNFVRVSIAPDQASGRLRGRARRASKGEGLGEAGFVADRGREISSRDFLLAPHVLARRRLGPPSLHPPDLPSLSSQEPAMESQERKVSRLFLTQPGQRQGEHARHRHGRWLFGPVPGRIENLWPWAPTEATPPGHCAFCNRSGKRWCLCEAKIHPREALLASSCLSGLVRS